jgi:hypothetical protein
MRSLSRFTQLFGAIIILGAFAACGGSTSPTATSGTTPAPGAATATPAAYTPAPTTAAGGSSDAWALNTTAEVAAAVGSPVTATGKVIGNSGTTNCSYATADGTVVIIASLTPTGGAGVYNQAKNIDGGQVVAGIGDGAVYDPSFGLVVLKGDATYSIYIVGPTDAASAIAETTPLAQAAAGRF